MFPKNLYGSLVFNSDILSTPKFNILRLVYVDETDEYAIYKNYNIEHHYYHIDHNLKVIKIFYNISDREKKIVEDAVNKISNGKKDNLEPYFIIVYEEIYDKIMIPQALFKSKQGAKGFTRKEIIKHTTQLIEATNNLIGICLVDKKNEELLQSYRDRKKLLYYLCDTLILL